MLQNSKSSFRCDLTKQQMVPTLNAVPTKGASKKGKMIFPISFTNPGKPNYYCIPCIPEKECYENHPRKITMPRMRHFLERPRLKVEIWQTSNHISPDSAKVDQKNYCCTNSRPEHTLQEITFVCKRNTFYDQVILYISNLHFQNILIESVLL